MPLPRNYARPKVHKEVIKMKKYEVMYILRSNLDQETIKGEVAKVNDLFTNNGAKVLEVKEWGLRELAYEIQKSCST